MDDYRARYYEYLQSDWWKKTRDKCIEAAGHHCYCCNKPYELQVHHITYEHVGMERDHEIICLCKNCHEWIEEQKLIGYRDPEQQRTLLDERRRTKFNLGFDNISYFDIEALFIPECIKNDISNGGRYNLEDREEIRRFFEHFCEQNGITTDKPVRTSQVQKAINPYRYHLILDYLDKGYPPYLTIQQTGCSDSMVRKVYKDPDVYRERLTQFRRN